MSSQEAGGVVEAAIPRRSTGAGPTGAIWGIAGALAVLFSAVSLVDHYMFRTTAYDLGIFDQAVRSYAHFHWPVSDLKAPGFPLLGDHFHPILALLAPFYWIWPSAMMLLVAQAVLFGLSVVPITRFAVERLGQRPGLLIGAAYGLSWGVWHAIWFDFHEIAFAVPMLAFGLVALARRQWLAAAAWTAPLLLVKEELALTVIAVGVYIFFAGSRRIGLGLAALGAIVGWLLLFVIIPAINPDGVYPYLSFAQDATSQVSHNPFVRFFTPFHVKAMTVVWLLIPTLLLCLLSPIVALAVPTLTWRFWVSNSSYWGTDFHYNAILMPMIFVAMVHGLTRTTYRWAWLATVVRSRTTVAVLTFLVAIYSTYDVAYDRREIINDWKPFSQVKPEHDILAMIPDGATVSAANPIAPQLTDRDTVYLFPHQTDPVTDSPLAEWVVVSTMHSWPLTDEDYAAAKAALSAKGYDLVAQAGRVQIYRRYHS